MTADELHEDFGRGFAGRKFWAGLLISFIDLFKELDVPKLAAEEFDDVLAAYPRQAWQDYRGWLDTLATFSAAHLYRLRGHVATYVLNTLKSQAFDPASIPVGRPLFRLLPQGFGMTAK